MEEKKVSKISNTEWGLVIGALAVIDLIQIGLDLLAQFGVVANRFIDIVVGLGFALYLQLRGESMADPKRLAGLIGTFIGEEIPDVDALPFWTLDGLYNMSLSKATKILENVPVAGSVITTALEASRDKEMSRAQGSGVVERINRSTDQVKKMNAAIKNRSKLDETPS